MSRFFPSPPLPPEIDDRRIAMFMAGALASAAAAPADTTPDAFSFTDQTGVAQVVTITSVAITVSGITAAASISVSGGTYSINGGAFTAVPGSVVNGDQVQARHTSHTDPNGVTNTIVTIGGVSDTFTSTVANAYDWTLVDDDDDTTEVVNFGFLTNTTRVNDGDLSGTGRDEADSVPGWSFPHMTLTTCSSATLTINSVTQVVAGNFKVRGLSALTHNKWSAGNLAVGGGAAAVASEATAISSAVGAKVLNITTMMQQMLAVRTTAQRVNFWGEATSLGMFVTLGDVMNATPARLQMTP